jgi:hypothetical protein
VVGTQLLTDDEKNLFMNADEYFNIDKVEVTFPLTKGRQVMTEIAKPEGHKDGEPYTNTVMVPYYDPEELEAALAKKELDTSPRGHWKSQSTASMSSTLKSASARKSTKESLMRSSRSCSTG